jgi:effector-binding domain-containing protein
LIQSQVFDDLYIVYTKFVFALPFLLFTLNLMGFEAMHEKTPVGEIKVLQLPARTALEANAGQSYFSENNGLFRTLFRYISKHDLSMTTPVEAEIEPGKMRFFVGGKDANKSRPSTDTVSVKELEPMLVLAIGIRGSYDEENFRKNQDRLFRWIEEQTTYEPAGDPYAVYWDGPFIPWLLKRSEIHLPIRLSIQESETNQPIENP